MNLRPMLQKLYPQGSIGPGSGDLQGQCVEFCHAIVDFGTMGDTYRQKKAFVDAYGVTAPNIAEIAKGFRIGDIVVTSDGTLLGLGAGHAFIVADQDANYLYAAESNFSLKKRVTYGRAIAKTSSKICGIVRAPLKLDLGVCNLDYDVFLNNFSKAWGLQFLDEVKQKISDFTGSRVQVTFYPLNTACVNWDYKIYLTPYSAREDKLISKEYFDASIMPLSFTNHNNPSHLVAFVVRPDQWQGSGDDLAYYMFGTHPAEIQIVSNEFDMSPWYAGMRLIEHTLIHEMAHWSRWVNGKDDPTHIYDNQNRQLEHVFDGIDWNRIIANI